jgi:hypothetical protein
MQQTGTEAPRLSRRFQSFPGYPLADVPGIKRELVARGVDVIDLGAGDADLAPVTQVRGAHLPRRFEGEATPVG